MRVPAKKPLLKKEEVEEGPFSVRTVVRIKEDLVFLKSLGSILFVSLAGENVNGFTNAEWSKCVRARAMLTVGLAVRTLSSSSLFLSFPLSEPKGNKF